MGRSGEAKALGVSAFVAWFRAAAPYIHAFRGKIFVLAFGGDAMLREDFVDLIYDINLLNALGVRLVGLTAAVDNVRSARVIEAAGFVSMGERESVRPDGSVRVSRYWELSREAWLRR